MLSVDLHVHSNCSSDGESDIASILNAARKAGLDAIAITDHDSVGGCLIAAGLKSDILVIPGIEVSTKQGHLLVLGVSEPIPKGMDVLETISLARSRGAVTILPHPFHRYRHGVGLKTTEALKAVDAIEVFNSRYIVGSANRRALKRARKLGKPIVSGSDAHHCRYVGYGKTMIEAERSVESILEAIRNGRTRPAGRRTPVRAYTRQSISNTWRKFKIRILR